MDRGYESGMYVFGRQNGIYSDIYYFSKYAGNFMATYSYEKIY